MDSNYRFPAEWFVLQQAYLAPIRALKVIEEPVRKGTIVTLKVDGRMLRGEVFREPIFKKLYRVVGVGEIDEKGTYYQFKRVDGASIVALDISLLKAGTTIKVVSRLPLSKILPKFEY